MDKPNTQYIDDFLRCTCAPDMLTLELFPNVKEITESFAAYNATRRYLFKHFQLADPSVVVIAVGDGSTPRTAATFAYRSRWHCHSVDPVLRDRDVWKRVQRLSVHRKKIEECDASDFGITPDSTVLVAAVHSHASLTSVMNVIGGARRIGIVAIPCCVPLTLPLPVTEVFEDPAIWSPHRTVSLWEIDESEERVRYARNSNQQTTRGLSGNTL